jgi:deoxyribodipyrimidine photo-lyase
MTSPNFIDPPGGPAAPRPFARALVWLRRDLRTHDNAALSLALQRADTVWVVFCLDQAILNPLPRRDRRVQFIVQSLHALDADLRQLAVQAGAAHAPQVQLLVRHGPAVACIAGLAQALHAQAVFASHDDEPDALARDAQVRGALSAIGCAMFTTKDHVVMERREVLSQQGTPYGVFTPYKNQWLKTLRPETHLAEWPVATLAQRLGPVPAALAQPLPQLHDIGFETTNLSDLQLGVGQAGALALLADFEPRMPAYDAARNFPAVKGPSYLGMHLRFGTVSVRELVRRAQAVQQGPATSAGAATFVSELIWRDFYHQVLHHHPHVATRAFKPEYDAIAWDKGKAAQALFAAWCEGRTGYPLVDAAMAQINQTGYMHNRLRMVVASFLTKDLGLDWRWGEAYFATHLNDFDLAANNGGWQWASSSGCDAQPYFRIFNPVSQSEKFDPAGKFIRRYVPQLAALPNEAIHAPWLARPIDLSAAGVQMGKNYPMPIVMHDEARLRTLARYAVVKKPK